MKLSNTHLISLVAAVVLQASITCTAFPGLKEVHEFGNNPGNLAFFEYTSDELKNNEAKRPLVLVMHGCNQSAGAIARTSDWNMLADRYGFYVAYPEQRIINNPSRCFNWFRKKDYLGNRGEVESIHSIIQYMKQNYPIDSSQVFIYGVSAGAAISVAYMANHPDVMNTGAILAGSSFGMAHNALDGMRVMLKAKRLSTAEWQRRFQEGNPAYSGSYPRLIAMHGLKDPVVDRMNSHELVKQWLGIHELDSVPHVMKAYQTNPELTRVSYYDRDSIEVIIHYEMGGLGHALAVNPGDKNDEFGGRTGAFAKDVGFFATYWIAKDFGLTEP